ncbi:hypothetical protein SAMN04488518_1244 [Pseudovibrio ascidiaceicola]|uniref:Uncharacterized protein n=1 Tax=Pseudovibrio ascidiaceicola TaxID=285279 RepID=A0A1I4G0H0_9HYPH|nr:hypothetical protein SAMN04488518_1244 [Pseudovibrio ascidiaceicola]
MWLFDHLRTLEAVTAAARHQFTIEPTHLVSMGGLLSFAAP